MTVRRHSRYSTEFKIQLVQAYLDGEGSARSIAMRCPQLRYHFLC